MSCMGELVGLDRHQRVLGGISGFGYDRGIKGILSQTGRQWRVVDLSLTHLHDIKWSTNDCGHCAGIYPFRGNPFTVWNRFYTLHCTCSRMGSVSEMRMPIVPVRTPPLKEHWCIVYTAGSMLRRPTDRMRSLLSITTESIVQFSYELRQKLTCSSMPTKNSQQIFPYPTSKWHEITEK